MTARSHDQRILRGRLADASTAPVTGETFTRFAYTAEVMIESIHSSDSPDPEEYDQDHDEWVIVIDGSAQLEVDGQMVQMASGDWILIPAGVRHRVLSTRQGTRWLAVHFGGPTRMRDRSST